MEDRGSGGRRKKLGEALIEQGLVTREQLNDALRHRAQEGGHLGSILVESKALSVDDLIRALSRCFDVPGVDLCKGDISREALELVPLSTMKRHQILPLATEKGRVLLAMTHPTDADAVRDIEFMTGREVRARIVPDFQMQTALKLLESSRGKHEGGIKGSTIADAVRRKSAPVDLPSIRQLLKILLDEDASDLLLVAGAPPSLKKQNQVQRMRGVFLTPAHMEGYARQIMSKDQWEDFTRDKELDFAFTLPDMGRFRVNVYRQRRSISMAIRPIVENIPSLEQLGLPGWLRNFALYNQGLILVTGPNGHGKTTTIASLVDIINTEQRRNIITIEDPVEFLHSHKRSLVHQREVGVDTASFGEGLRHVFREAPDVIVIGEMRDMESFSIALQAADSGHLVISSLHANSAVQAINRVVDVFPPEQERQIRVQLAESFLLILNQRLVPTRDGQGRAMAYEKLTNSYRVRNQIREGKESQIRSLLQQAGEELWSLDVSLAQLCARGIISEEEALHYCQDRNFFLEMKGKGRDFLGTLSPSGTAIGA